jgi:hypothetical protein
LAESVTPAAARGSGAPAGTAAQVPRLFGNAQKLHLPVQALSQQTPSAQERPDTHSAVVVQVWPLPRLPQLPLVQVLGAMH